MPANGSIFLPWHDEILLECEQDVLAGNAKSIEWNGNVAKKKVRDSLR